MIEGSYGEEHGISTTILKNTHDGVIEVGAVSLTKPSKDGGSEAVSLEDSPEDTIMVEGDPREVVLLGHPKRGAE